MGGLGHGLAGLVGAGSLYDPMGKLKTDLANANAQMQQTVNTGTVTALHCDPGWYGDPNVYCGDNEQCQPGWNPPPNLTPTEKVTIYFHDL